MLGVFAEFETNLRRERQAEGIAAAKNKGIYKGRPPSINQDKIKQHLLEGKRPTQIAKELEISRGTIYKIKQLIAWESRVKSHNTIMSLLNCSRNTIAKVAKRELD